MREDAILHKMQTGDPSGLESLMDIYIPYVSTVVWNILRGAMSQEDGEEVVSDVFLAAWQQSSELKPGFVKGWLAAVARNKAKNKLRKMGKTLPLEDDFLDIPGPNDPLNDVEQAEEQQLVRKAIQSLPEQDQEIFYDIITTLKRFKRSPLAWQSMNQPSKPGLEEVAQN